jgi:hypothetical protein
MKPLEVGDEGVVIFSERSTTKHPAKVIKLGRKWATLDWPSWRPVRVRIDDGSLHYGPNEIANGGRFYTPEALALKDAAEAARVVIRANGLSGAYGADWPEERLVALAAWLGEN